MSLGMGIIGCGLIGLKRSQNLAGARLVACADINEERARRVAQRDGASVLADYRALLAMPGVDVVVVATLHDSLAEITRAAIESGRHVLVEKPAARHSAELEPLVQLAAERAVLVRVGFNHRYHRAFRQARRLHLEGVLGELMFLRARYGHGGRVGYDREWRANAEVSGGGELIDQGPHLIDLARWFLGDFSEVDGFAHTYFWDMPVDDNGFMMLKTPGRQVAFMHASCTEWKNLFSMEIYGRDAKLEISGLGGSYGVERLTCYRMLPEMGPPETTSWEYPMADDSWSVEMAEFLEDIHLNRQPAAGLPDAIAALRVIETIYRKSGYDHRP
ncbi:Gfo/Idh/MocA family oxidoreductase [soil metagenome]